MWAGGGGVRLNRFYRIPTSPSASVMAQNIQLVVPKMPTETTCCDRHLEIPRVTNNT